MTGIVFDRTAGLVGKFAEINFESMARSAEHIDVRTGAEDSRLEAGDDDRAYFRMLKSQTLNSIGELDINPEVVRVELELVTFGECLIFLDIHRKSSDLPFDVQFPVFVMRRRR